MPVWCMKLGKKLKLVIAIETFPFIFDNVKLLAYSILVINSVL